jgi:tRNA (guanine6-N2)-methyltransferase
MRSTETELHSSEVHLLLTTVPGVEDIAVQELGAVARATGVQLLSTEISPSGGQGHVSCQLTGETSALMPAVLRMRSIHHVYRLVHRFVLPEEGELDAVANELGACVIPEMASAASFRVTSERKGNHSFSSMDLARQAGGTLHDRYQCKVDLKNYDLDVHVDVYDRTCIVSVPLTKGSLNRLRKRVFSPRIGLQPVLAFCLLQLADLEDGEGAILDPFCGAGTILLEAAELFPRLRLHGSDTNEEAIAGATENARSLGVLDRISLQRGRAQDIERNHRPGRFDAIITNPPFGVRIGRKLNFYCLYRDFLNAAHTVLKPDGRLVVLVWKRGTFLQILRDFGSYSLLEERRVTTGELHPSIFVLRPNGKSAGAIQTDDSMTGTGEKAGRAAMSNRIKELEQQIAELKDRWPAHSARPSMLEELEDLEEKLEKAREAEKAK